MSTNHPIKQLDMIVLPPEEDKQWAQVIGSLILLFGSAEFISFHFIGMLDGSDARDKAMKKTFSDRIQIVKKLIEGSKWPDDEKTEALKLWTEVAGKCKFRNAVAHNPFIIKIEKGHRVVGILKIRQLRGAPPYRPDLIRLSSVIEIHNRMKDIVFALNALAKPR